MCDTPTRLWCCRIGLIFTILGVLITMIYQIWTYYFYLVQQMDDMTLDTPELHSIVQFCSNTTRIWHATCSANWTCVIPSTEGADTYVDVSAGYRATLNGEILEIEALDTSLNCFRAMVWRLPWEY